MKSSKVQDKYTENINILLREVTHYKHANFKKETRNIIKIKHFLKYFESCNNSFMNTPLDLLWSPNYLTPKFLEDISVYEYNEIIPLIIQLLIGDFKNTIKKKKLVNLKEKNQKLCSFYFLPINKNDNIFFCLCLEGTFYLSSTMHFLSVSRNWDFEDVGKEFLEKLNNNKNFPLIDYDKNGIYLVDEILFSHKEKDGANERIICYPLRKINIKNNTIFSKTYVHKKEIVLFKDADDFKDNELNESIISQIEDNQYENIIISAIEGDVLGCQLSTQEKSFVKDSDTFIISGRPGTGKTTVILFKLFSIYFNYELKKNLWLKNEKRRNNLKNEIKNSQNKIKNDNKTTESLRVVFTSLSQHLCEKQKNIFEEIMVNKMEEIKPFYSPVSSHLLKTMSSFRNLSKYPIFANFRKIMFMIDGSLTFQFFSRLNLDIYEGDHDTEYFYSKDYKYEVNQYSSNQNYKYINFFYRNPVFVNVIELKESNERTFIKFYEEFLLKRKKIPLADTLYKLNLNPLEIYAQLISVIKGSYSSHLYMNNCISKEDYKLKGRKITDLPNLDDIYDVCMLYEEYKKGKYFDIQDLVNFLIRQVKLEFKDIKLIDYLFLDEIQDLTISQVYLLALVSKHCKIYAGDTCQTISKINRFRFSELKNIFYNFSKVIPNYPKVNEAYLNLNYRLNSKILSLSTFMAYLMKILFPNTIDKFQDDFSIKIIERKPIYLNNINLIIDKISNNQQNNNARDYTLTANHCFIYNDEKDGDNLNQLYGDNIYKLNVEQSKGLEFELVISYNFFSSSKFQGLWNKIFSNIEGEKNNSINSSSVIKLNNILRQEKIQNLIETLNLKNIYSNLQDIEKKIVDELKNFVYPKELNNSYDKHEIFEFCSELKKFYVVITRPKTFLVFYENNLNRDRSGFYKFMNSNNINLIDYEDNNNNSQSNFLNEINMYFKNINLIVESHDNLRIIGNTEFKEGHYSRASFLYKKANHQILALISEVFNLKEILDEEINLSDSNKIELNNLNNEIVNKASKLIEIQESTGLQSLIEEDENAININDIYEQIINYNGKSLINLNRYDEAIELYMRYGLKYNVGMIYYKYKEEYQLSFRYFNEIGNYKFALKSLIKTNDYKKAFDYTNKIASFLFII